MLHKAWSSKFGSILGHCNWSRNRTDKEVVMILSRRLVVEIVELASCIIRCKAIGVLNERIALAVAVAVDTYEQIVVVRDGHIITIRSIYRSRQRVRVPLTVFCRHISILIQFLGCRLAILVKVEDG